MYRDERINLNLMLDDADQLCGVPGNICDELPKTSTSYMLYFQQSMNKDEILVSVCLKFPKFVVDFA